MDRYDILIAWMLILATAIILPCTVILWISMFEEIRARFSMHRTGGTK